MAPSTAIGLMLCCVVVLYLSRSKEYGIGHRIVSVLVVFVSIFGLLEVFDHFLGTDLNCEDILIPISKKLNEIPLARMSPVTGGVFFGVGIALLLLLRVQKHSKNSKIYDYISGCMGLAALSVGFTFTLAYLYGMPLLYNMGAFVPMAFTTSLAFIFLSLSILSFDKRLFPIRLIVGNRTQNYLLRFILPLSVASIFLGSFSIIYALQITKVNPAIVSALLIILVIVATSVISAWIAHHHGKEIDHHTAMIKEAKDSLQKSEAQFRTLFETMALGVVYQNDKGRITSVNPAAEQIFGQTTDQLIGKMLTDPEWRAIDKEKNKLLESQHPAVIALHTGKPVINFLYAIFNSKQNEYVWVLVNSIPQFSEGANRPYQVFSTFLDITGRTKAEEDLRKLKDNLLIEVENKTKELNERIAELEHFYDVTIERELRLGEMREEIVQLKKGLYDKKELS
jgi:PAS domain S-box-containing protein